MLPTSISRNKGIWTTLRFASFFDDDALCTLFNCGDYKTTHMITTSTLIYVPHNSGVLYHRLMKNFLWFYTLFISPVVFYYIILEHIWKYFLLKIFRKYPPDFIDFVSTLIEFPMDIIILALGYISSYKMFVRNINVTEPGNAFVPAGWIIWTVPHRKRAEISVCNQWQNSVASVSSVKVVKPCFSIIDKNFIQQGI